MDKIIALQPIWRQPKFRFSALTIAAMLLAGGSLWQWRANASPQAELHISSLQTALVRSENFSENLQLRGVVLPQQTVFLDAIEGGRVEQRLAEPGSYVEAGQPLVQLTNTALQLDFISREAQVSEQLSFLRTTELAMATTELDLKQQVLDASHAIRQLERQIGFSKPLVDRGVLAKEQLRTMEEDLAFQREKLQLSQQRQQQQLTVQQVQKKQLQDSVAMLSKNIGFARQQLQNLLVRAPVSGYLSEFQVEPGESKAPGSRLGQIDIPGRFKLQAQVDEFYLSRIQPGMSATLQSPATPANPQSIQISRIDSRVVNNQFSVELLLPEQFQGKRGQTLIFDLLLEQSTSQSLVLPRGAYLTDGGGQFVYVLDQRGKATRRAVQLGRQSSQSVEIRTGLVAGENVIISSYRDFRQADQLQFNTGNAL
ncbi:efflux transporter periplasmic adaptor subunit [Rheinheimera sp. SA_1]|uniref:efflux RND transporter periplasmic adaptor subunit n=1 Tax=Rheinheimera sp. SA_1 TaxID=1827365 RepID=UPI0007FD42B8|nr:efflux RND transporter periplasmic adaptor subunit [Rheinheimera sp. SA_1]OBP13366.1 efflux transporter periplasmic adaptor subunit [Rheinheimera sp. SA_1]